MSDRTSQEKSNASAQRIKCLENIDYGLKTPLYDPTPCKYMDTTPLING